MWVIPSEFTVFLWSTNSNLNLISWSSLEDGMVVYNNYQTDQSGAFTRLPRKHFRFQKQVFLKWLDHMFAMSHLRQSGLSTLWKHFGEVQFLFQYKTAFMRSIKTWLSQTSAFKRNVCVPFHHERVCKRNEERGVILSKYRPEVCPI